MRDQPAIPRSKLRLFLSIVFVIPFNIFRAHLAGLIHDRPDASNNKAALVVIFSGAPCLGCARSGTQRGSASHRPRAFNCSQSLDFHHRGHGENRDGENTFLHTHHVQSQPEREKPHAQSASHHAREPTPPKISIGLTIQRRHSPGPKRMNLASEFGCVL
jgi:hypothetical protein